MNLIISGETPSKKNSKIMNTKTHRLFPSQKYKEWHDKAMLQVLFQKSQSKEIFPITKCKIKLEFYHADNKRRDSDNGTSSIFDLLVDCGILEDDNWQVVNRFEVENKKSEKKCSFVKIAIDTL